MLYANSVVSIGRRAYSLYLWHWVVIVAARWTIGLHWWTIPVLIILILLFAEASYRFVENPLRMSSWGSGPATIGISAALLGIAWLAIIMLYQPFHSRLYLGKRPALIAEGVHTLVHGYALPGQCFLARRRMYSDRERRGRQDHQHGAVHAWQLGVGEAPHTRSR